MSNLIEKSTLSEQVQNHIFQLIKDQKLKPKMEIPSEMQFIETLGVSRGVVREAFRSLSTLGVLSIGSGRRPTVQTVNPDALSAILCFAISTEQVTPTQILELRRSLEISCADLAARNGTEEDFAEIRGIMTKMRKDFNQVEEFVRDDSAFHLAIARATKNPLHELLLTALRSALENSILVGLSAHEISGSGGQIIELHQQISDALCDRDTERAMAAMANHFDSAVNAIVSAKQID